MALCTRRVRPGGRTLLSVTTVAAMVLFGLVAIVSPTQAAVLESKAPFLQRTDEVVTADPLPTVQIDDGYVWAQTTIGTTVYAAGGFSNARAPLASPGTNLTPRSNILAFDITNGDLLPFAPEVNGVIRAIAPSPDGTRLYIGGTFNRVNGESRWNFAALDASTGELIPGFAPAIGGTGVYGLAVTANTIYMGGLFTQVNGVARKNLAAVDASNGALRPWAPTTDLQIDALVIEPGAAHIVAGGRFSQVNGVTQRGLVALEPTSGGIDTGWAAPYTVKNGAPSGKAGIFGLGTDAGGIYGTGWVFADVNTGNLEGVFAADAGTGDIRWVVDCHGDHYGVYSTGSVVYATSHAHACETGNLWPEQSPRTYRYAEAFTTTAEGTLTRSMGVSNIYADWSGTPSPSAYAWYPDFTVGRTSGLGQAGLSITGAGDFISIAGEFTSVNNLRYEGIVRFSTKPSGGANQRPQLSSSEWGAPTATGAAAGQVQVTIKTNWDRDDRDLTYELLRDGGSTPVASQVFPSGWWTTGSAVLTDSGLSPGSSHTYRVRAVDADGNSVTSQAVTATAGSATSSDYADMVLADGAEIYYPLGSIDSNWAGTNQPTIGSVSTVTPGAVGGATGQSASTFSGSSSSIVATSEAMPGNTDFTVELWFKTSTNRGGKLIGFGNSRSGSSSKYDRHVYMRNDGRLMFGVYPNQTKTVASSSAYNDGEWHHVVATQSWQGIRLYVDGALAGQDPTAGSGDIYNGYWRIGGDTISGWPNSPSSTYFAGDIDEVAVYPGALTAEDVATHYATGLELTAPAAEFTVEIDNLEINVDGTASTADTGATIQGYSWDFGDGTPAESGPTATHTYETTGTYTVALTVTDSRGLTGTSVQQVTVEAANVLPTASLETQVDGLTVNVDGTSSSDVDGEIVEYDWDWGDGSEPGIGETATHTYATDGEYTISLVVTDDRGATDTVSQSVTVEHAAPEAAFSLTSDRLDVFVDATISSATDGASLDYSWDWGDGSGDGTGVTASHSYASSGDYTITLTVTDSLGATDQMSQTVHVENIALAASDGFGRSVPSGWGSADVGGMWTVSGGPASAASVADGEGHLELAPAAARNVTLGSLSLQDVSAQADFSIDVGPEDGASYVGMRARVDGADAYMVLAWLRGNGDVWLVLQRGGAVLQTTPLSGVSWEAGDSFTLQTQVTGESSTTISAKLWKAGSQEPALWQSEVEDSAGLPAGGVGVYAYRSGSADGAGLISVDNFQAEDLG